jgi:uncharacterized protein (DUF1499 family)
MEGHLNGRIVRLSKSYTVEASSIMFKFSGTRPSNLGVESGRLKVCPDSPNCVCSSDSDKEHGIAAIDYSQADAMNKLKGIINGMERTAIIIESEDYLHVEFTTKLMGYVDDVEFYINGGVIQVRSASRLGKSDLGLNRQRIEAIRAAF